MKKKDGSQDNHNYAFCLFNKEYLFIINFAEKIIIFDKKGSILLYSF
jgi:hypothetical protein